MKEEEKKEYEELKSLLYTGQLSQYGKRRLIEIIETQKHTIEGKEALIDTMAHNEEVFNEIIEKKDKMINLMAEQLTTPINDKKWVIEYYTKLAEEIKNEI